MLQIVIKRFFGTEKAKKVVGKNTPYRGGGKL